MVAVAVLPPPHGGPQRNVRPLAENAIGAVGQYSSRLARTAVAEVDQEGRVNRSPQGPTPLSVMHDIGMVLGVNAAAFTTTEYSVAARLLEHEPWELTPGAQAATIEALMVSLQTALVAQIGSRLTRHYRDGDAGEALAREFEPRIIVATDDDEDFFDPLDHPRIGWSPLALVYRREAGWDFTPQPEEGAWVGWWEPDSIHGGEDWATVNGQLVGFITVRNAVITHGFVASMRRREGIARRLFEFARNQLGAHAARGPFTAAGAALADAMGFAKV